jgi:hypothetical protein
MRIEQERSFFAPSVSLRWDKSRRTSWRITHSRSLVSSEAYEATDLDGVVYDVARDLWANDTRIELLLRNLRTAREGRGLYFVTGWTFRSIWMRYHLDPDPPADPSWDIYPYVTFFDENDVRSYFDFFTLWSLGPGYDRRFGPVDLFVEPSAEVYFSYLRGGGGDPISLRPRISLGINYSFGRPVPDRH